MRYRYVFSGSIILRGAQLEDLELLRYLFGHRAENDMTGGKCAVSRITTS